MSRVIEAATGAQILPHVGDERATLAEYAVICAARGDLRTKHAIWRDIAGRLVVVPDETKGA